MKTRKFNQYYFGVIRGAAVVAGVVLLVTQVAYSASTDATPKWIFHADTALPASDAHSATQLAQDDGRRQAQWPPVPQPMNRPLPTMRPWCSARAIA